MVKTVRIHRHGGPEVLQYDDVAETAPDTGEVAIDVRAIGVNRSEAMFRFGRHPETVKPVAFPARLGFEAAGVVRAVGADVKDIAVGDVVSLFPPPSVTRWGTYSEIATVPAEYVIRHPAAISFEQAAASWMQFVTAYGGLIDLGRLKVGDAALILAASSSVGLASIAIANAVGAVSIATTRSSAKKQALLDHGAQHVIVTDEENLVDRVAEITGGRGARVVFDPVGGPGINTLLQSMSPFGILVSYGALDQEPTPLPLFPIISAGLTIRGFSFKEIAIDPERRERAKTFILAGLESGLLRPVIDKIFPFDEMVAAHRYLESNQQFGKIVVSL